MTIIHVACAIILKEEKILVTQRGLQMKHPGLWEFPGGKIEEGETAESCLHRELHEELSINVRIMKALRDVYYDYGNYQIKLFPFIAEMIEGNITLSEHMKYEWMKMSELPSLHWVPADVAVVEELLQIAG